MNNEKKLKKEFVVRVWAAIIYTVCLVSCMVSSAVMWCIPDSGIPLGGKLATYVVVLLHVCVYSWLSITEWIKCKKAFDKLHA